MHHLSFERDRFKAFVSHDRDGPINMLNLLRFHPVAAYEDDRQSTGAEAYATYGRASAPVLERVGG